MNIVKSRRFLLSRRESPDGMRLHVAQSAQPSESGLFAGSPSAIVQHIPHKLSQIREASGSPKASIIRKKSPSSVDDTRHLTSSRPEEKDNFDADRNITLPQSNYLAETPAMTPLSPQSDIKSLAPSALSLPAEDIPKRKSSITALNRSFPESHRASLPNQQRSGDNEEQVEWTPRGADSPVRDAVERAVQSSETLQAPPCRTFVRTTTPLYLLEDDNASNPRVAMSVRLPSPLFVSGGTVDGQIELKIDTKSSKKMRSKPLLISRLSVDVMGVEQVEDGKRHIFLSLATELFDSTHPPPRALVHSQTPEKPERGSELYWRTRPATATVPFSLNLPLKVGPPPYLTRQASIRYILCPSAVVKIGEMRSAIRQTWTIQILPVHNPDKALINLPSPLLATDTLTLSHLPIPSSVKLTAGLHRQTWVSGSMLFTDVHITNSTEKPLQRLNLQLQKSTLWFLHSAAGTSSKSASHLRLPSKIDTEIVCKNTLKRSKQWDGVASQAAELRTCELQIPRGHVTIGNGRYFEVRYFVKVTVVIGRNKVVSVQLPVTLIHINSLDVLPNSAAQVAESIEAKRSLTAVARMATRVLYKPHSQSQAFNNAQGQSFTRLQELAAQIDPQDLCVLTEAVDNSPRQNYKNPDTAITCALDTGDEAVYTSYGNAQPRRLSCHQHLSSRPSCYHCHLLHAEHATRSNLETGPKLPRLQVSTSGLGFTESEFELPPDSPLRKVMLSEKERHMINQQREIRMQRQWSQHRRNRSHPDEQNRIGMHLRGPSARPDTPRHERGYHSRRFTQHTIPRVNSRSSAVPQSNAGRNRDRTSIERKRASYNDSIPATSIVSRPARGIRSMDWNGNSMV